MSYIIWYRGASSARNLIVPAQAHLAWGTKMKTALRTRSAAAVALTPLMTAAAASAQCDPRWLPGEGIPGVAGEVHATTTWDPDGPGPEPELLVVGGNFDIAGDLIVHNVAAWDGTRWHALGDGIGRSTIHPCGPFVCSFDSSVYALAVYNGDLIAAGEFTHAGELSASSIARWDGLRWWPLGAGVAEGDSRGFVRALTIFNGELVVGGRFTTAGGSSASNIARWDGAHWQVLGGGVNAPVRALGLYDGNLLASGSFTTAGDVQAERMARWDGARWSRFDDGPGLEVASFAIFENELVAGSGVGIVRWRSGQWQTIGGGIGGLSLAVYNEELVAGGFTTLARWDGAVWQPLGSGVGGPVYALAAYRGEIVAGGDFHSAGGVGVSAIARSDGNDWQPLGTGLNLRVDVMTVYNGDLIAGGYFSVPDTGARYIARWDGAQWRPLGLGIDGPVSAMTIHNGELVAGGRFGIAGGRSVDAIARWDGTQWLALGTGGWRGIDPYVDSLTVYNGELIAGGGGFNIGVGPFNGVARWDGTQWDLIGGESIFVGDTRVSGLGVYNGDLIAGGAFTTIGGVAANNIARWDGAQWYPLGAGIDGGAGVLAVYNGELYAAVGVVPEGGASTRGIARWDGAQWRAVGGGLTATPPRWPSVGALMAYNGELIAGGFFNSAGGVTANNVARWDGTHWRTLGTGLGPHPFDSYVLALTVHNDELVVGGTFTTAGGHAAPYWARWGTGARAGDLNCNGSVDLEDLPEFLNCLAGPDMPYRPGCVRVDLEPDDTVDLFDFAAFQRLFTGP